MTVLNAAWETLAQIRAKAPRVETVSNLVAMDVVANTLLAVGAVPIMAHGQEELAEIVAHVRAVSVNCGTPSPERTQAMRTAAQAAVAYGKPWVLDPVGVGASRYRRRLVEELLTYSPVVVRGNAGEVRTLAEQVCGPTAKGPGTGPEVVRDAARALARTCRAVVVATGETDVVTTGTDTVMVANGNPLMRAVTGMGCALTSLVAAFCAVCADPLVAATHAVAVFAVAGERAGVECPGPGTLRMRLLDELYRIDRPAIEAGLRLTIGREGGSVEEI